MSIRYNEELDPNDGPSFTEFVVLGTLFAVILLLIPVGVFALSWPVWVLAILMVLDLVLLFLVSMTSVFLLRIFFADRRRGRGRNVGVAKGPAVVISSAPTPESPASVGDGDPTPSTRDDPESPA
jgi:hypothetical protein